MRNNKLEVQSVKELGELMGYGHLMTVASALWRKHLKERGWPPDGTFIPTIEDFLQPKHIPEAQVEALYYDKFVDTALNS